MRTPVSLIFSIIITACQQTNIEPLSNIFTLDEEKEISISDLQQWLVEVRDNDNSELNTVIQEKGEIKGMKLIVKIDGEPALYTENITGPKFSEEALDMISKVNIGSKIWIDDIEITTETDDITESASYMIVE